MRLGRKTAASPGSGSSVGLGTGLSARLEALEGRFRALSPWLLYREEDSVLILPPNRVFKLGGSGPKLLSWLERGGRLAEIPGMDEARVADIAAFLDDLEAAEAGRSVEVERVPYDFGFTRLPVIGELALTYKCNAACAFCYAGCGVATADACAATAAPASPIVPGKPELSTRDAKHVIKIFKEEAKIPFFSFTGGEPLLRDDLEELLAYAHSLGLRTNLITNGSLATPARAASLAAAGLKTAQVSIESPDAGVHDALCGLEGGHARTAQGISNLQAAGISVQTNTTVTARNRAGLVRLPAFLKDLGVARFSMNLFIPSGRGLSSTGLAVSYSEIGGIVDGVRKAAHAESLTFFWYSPTPYCVYNPVARGLGNKSCAALDGLVHVNPYGEVLPCSSWPEPMGSLLERPFREIWLSGRSAFFKNKEFAPESCRACDSFVACQGACPLYWKTFGCAELEHKEVM